MKKGILALSFCLVSSFSVSNVAVAQDYNECETMLNQMLLISIKTRLAGKSIDYLRDILNSSVSNPAYSVKFNKMLDVTGNLIFDMSDKEFKRRMNNPELVINQMHEKVDEIGLCD